MCICVYVYMCICVYVYMCICVYVCVYVYMCVCKCISICKCACTCTCTCICICICKCACTCTCTCICICICIYFRFVSCRSWNELVFQSKTVGPRAPANRWRKPGRRALIHWFRAENEPNCVVLGCFPSTRSRELVVAPPKRFNGVVSGKILQPTVYVYKIRRLLWMFQTHLGKSSRREFHNKIEFSCKFTLKTIQTPNPLRDF